MVNKAKIMPEKPTIEPWRQIKFTCDHQKANTNRQHDELSRHRAPAHRAFQGEHCRSARKHEEEHEDRDRSTNGAKLRSNDRSPDLEISFIRSSFAADIWWVTAVEGIVMVENPKSAGCDGSQPASHGGDQRYLPARDSTNWIFPW
jgi:hypothetical protein